MAKKKKSSTKKVARVIISLIYIFWGLFSPLSMIGAILSLNIGAIVSAVVGVLTLLAGIFGLFGLEKGKCRAFGIIIFVFSAAAVVFALPTISVTAIINALLAWLFIVCV